MTGSNVVELGAGPALVSMAASILVGEKGYVLATDGNEHTVNLARMNVRRVSEHNTASTRRVLHVSPASSCSAFLTVSPLT